MQRGNLKLIDSERRAVLALDAVQTGLSPALVAVIEEIQREIGYEELEKERQVSEGKLKEVLFRVSEKLGLELTAYERDEVISRIERSQRPFGILQDLVNDSSISDIIVSNYSSVSIQQGRKNLATDISFASPREYENFVERLLHRAGTSYSTKKPIADGMIGAFARIHAVHRCLCESGPYLTIRLNRFACVGVEDLLKAGMAPRPVFDYLEGVVRAGCTVLVAGEVGSGKTTLVRALASSIPAEQAILVIEDTPEIRLQHPHVRYMSTREANTDGAGRIAPSECIRAGMRMAMNRIIFGEMRDAEAAEAFIDVCASGHPGLSTIHARSAAEAIARLELFLGRAQRGISRHVAYEQIAKAVQLIVHLDVCSVSGARRVMSVKEIGSVADGVIRTRDMFRYRHGANEAAWQVLTRVSGLGDDLARHGFSLASLPGEIPLNNRAGYV